MKVCAICIFVLQLMCSPCKVPLAVSANGHAWGCVSEALYFKALTGCACMHAYVPVCASCLCQCVCVPVYRG